MPVVDESKADPLLGYLCFSRLGGVPAVFTLILNFSRICLASLNGLAYQRDNPQ